MAQKFDKLFDKLILGFLKKEHFTYKTRQKEGEYRQPYNGNSASDKVAAIVVLSLATGDIMLFKVQHSHPA